MKDSMCLFHVKNLNSREKAFVRRAKMNNKKNFNEEVKLKRTYVSYLFFFVPTTNDKPRRRSDELLMPSLYRS